MKIAVRTPNWLGDIAFNLPMINALLKKHEVTIITKTNFAEIFDGFDVVTFSKKKELYTKHWNLRGLFDYYIITPISFSSALAAFISGAKNRVGFSFDLRDLLLTRKIKIPPDWKQKHTTETYFLLYEELVDKNEVKFEIQTPEKYRVRGTELLNTCGLSPHKYVSCAPFAQFGTAKEWYTPYFLELSKLLIKLGLKLVILGSKNDENRARELEDENTINLSGKTSIWEAVYIARNSIAFIGNDSGLTHLSALAGSNVVAIFGPTPVTWTRPIGPRVSVLKKDLPCSPCEKRECPLKTKECMRLVEPEDVFEIIRSLL
jgi:heptosyltransferase-2